MEILVDRQLIGLAPNSITYSSSVSAHQEPSGYTRRWSSLQRYKRRLGAKPSVRAAFSACHIEMEGMQLVRQRVSARSYLHDSVLCVMVSLMTVSRPALLDSCQLWSMSIVQCMVTYVAVIR